MGKNTDWPVVLGVALTMLAVCVALKLVVSCTPTQRAANAHDLDALCALRAMARDGGSPVRFVTDACPRNQSNALVECTGEAGAAP